MNLKDSAPAAAPLREAFMGAYHGRAGFETFSKAKPVFCQPRLNRLGLFRPPYGPRFERLMRFLSR